jgi:hypothetical protein
LARPAPSQRPHDPHSPGPLPHGPRRGLPGVLSLGAHPTKPVRYLRAVWLSQPHGRRTRPAGRQGL